MQGILFGHNSAKVRPESTPTAEEIVSDHRGPSLTRVRGQNGLAFPSDAAG